jgi:hypothetical protein
MKWSGEHVWILWDREIIIIKLDSASYAMAASVFPVSRIYRDRKTVLADGPCMKIPKTAIRLKYNSTIGYYKAGRWKKSGTEVCRECSESD